MNILIVGGSGAIGNGILHKLLQGTAGEGVRIFATYFSTRPNTINNRVTWLQLDARDEQQIQQLATKLPSLNWVINCAGVLHTPCVAPEKSIRQFSPGSYLHVQQINTLCSLLLAKHLIAKLQNTENGVFAVVSARIGSIEDNRLGGWYSYRISKAALNMALKTLSIEWQRTAPRVCVAALHPGTTDSNLSKPFQKNVPHDKLFSPATAAGHLLKVIQQLTPDKTGRFWSWDGSPLPW